MNTLIIFSLAFASAAANILGQGVSVTQDTLGKYDFKYAIDGISRSEHADGIGNVAGGFAFIDPLGVLRKTVFTSGIHGYNPVSSDIPVPVVDTPEVALAKSQHLAVLRAEQSRPLIAEFQDKKVAELVIPELPLVKSTQFVTIPVLHNGVIPDTPEVVAARAEHLAVHAAIRANHLAYF